MVSTVVILFISATLLVMLDQATKALVVSSFREGQLTSLGPLSIRRVLNVRGPLGFSSNRTTLLTLWVAAGVILLLVVSIGPFFQGVVAQAALGAALGGAGGNLCDRVRRGGVVDFIDLGCWPVFNLADVGIVAGALLATLFMR